VFVAKLIAVFIAESALTAGKSCGFSGSHCWTRCSRVDEQQTDDVECEHDERVALPAHVLVGLDARKCGRWRVLSGRRNASRGSVCRRNTSAIQVPSGFTSSSKTAR
jgi:hypothetical protein